MKYMTRAGSCSIGQKGIFDNVTSAMPVWKALHEVLRSDRYPHLAMFENQMARYKNTSDRPNDCGRQSPGSPRLPQRYPRKDVEPPEWYEEPAGILLVGTQT